MKDKLYLFNPFQISEWEDSKIKEQFEILIDKYDDEADILSLMALNVENLANQMYLIGEMIARYSQKVSSLKTSIKIESALIIQTERDRWVRVETAKAPALAYFEAKADSKMQEERTELVRLETNLMRFKYAYDSIENRMNALKKRIEVYKYEEFGE